MPFGFPSECAFSFAGIPILFAVDLPVAYGGALCCSSMIFGHISRPLGGALRIAIFQSRARPEPGSRVPLSDNPVSHPFSITPPGGWRP